MNDTVVLTEREEMQDLTQKGHKFLEMAKNLSVINDHTYKEADELVTHVARQIKAVTGFIDPHIKRANEAHKALTGDRTKMLAPLKEGKLLLNEKLSAYDDEIEMQMKKEEALIAEEARKKQKEATKAEEDRRLTEAQTLEDQGRKEEAEAVLNAPAPVAKKYVAPTPRGCLPKGNTSFRVKWEAEVIDKALVPDEYKTVNQGALDKIAQATQGNIHIPGCVMVKKKLAVNSTR